MIPVEFVIKNFKSKKIHEESVLLDFSFCRSVEVGVLDTLKIGKKRMPKTDVWTMVCDFLFSKKSPGFKTFRATKIPDAPLYFDCSFLLRQHRTMEKIKKKVESIGRIDNSSISLVFGEGFSKMSVHELFNNLLLVRFSIQKYSHKIFGKKRVKFLSGEKDNFKHCLSGRSVEDQLLFYVLCYDYLDFSGGVTFYLPKDFDLIDMSVLLENCLKNKIEDSSFSFFEKIAK